MDSKRFSTFKISETNIKTYLIEPKIIKMKTNGYLFSKNENSPIEISFYINYGNAKHVDVFIDSSPEKIEKINDYLYVKFKSAGCIISSTEKYPELMFNCGENKIPFELLLLKKDNKNLIIIKYPLINGSNDYGDISLLDIVNFE